MTQNHKLTGDRPAQGSSIPRKPSTLTPVPTTAYSVYLGVGGDQVIALELCYTLRPLSTDSPVSSDACRSFCSIKWRTSTFNSSQDALSLALVRDGMLGTTVKLHLNGQPIASQTLSIDYKDNRWM
jgi:hypothetical protein